MSGMSRREMGKLFLAVSASTLTAGRVMGQDAAPAANAGATAPSAAAPEGTAADTSPWAEFLSSSEPGLLPAERERLRKNITALQSSLEAIRQYPVSNAAAPAFQFRAMKSNVR